MAIEFHFTPELHLKDGRIIRDLDDALSFAREQEARPGVDQRDEILHKIEQARGKEAGSSCSTLLLEMARGARNSRVGTARSLFRSPRSSKRNPG